MATGKILLDTGRYYEFFHHRDNKWMQMGVALGTTAAWYVLFLPHISGDLLTRSALISGSVSLR
jgi:hypothetical protein